MMQDEQSLDNKRSRMSSPLVGKTIYCRKPEILITVRRPSYPAGSLGGSHDTGGGLKLSPIIFMSVSKDKIMTLRVIVAIECII